MTPNATTTASPTSPPHSPPRSRSGAAATAAASTTSTANGCCSSSSCRKPPTASPPRKALASPACASAASATASTPAAPPLVISTISAIGGKKRVRWSTITIHEFGVGLGGSAVPSKGGPAIGLADAAPEFTWTTRVGEMAERSEGLHRFSAEERVRLLQAAGESDGMILRFSRETNIILASRRRALADRAHADADSEEDEEDEDEEDAELEKAKAKKAREQERQAEALKRASRKRKAELHDARPCATFLGRPPMVPASYV
ncbi:hypothetical protein PybrP1_009740 [[Pythium] brassicae (nom. inval.)]|nr:hypothetical protein PybrP1_009740 [[Pythium] brassicae (nom. inval.)]